MAALAMPASSPHRRIRGSPTSLRRISSRDLPDTAWSRIRCWRPCHYRSCRGCTRCRRPWEERRLARCGVPRCRKGRWRRERSPRRCSASRWRSSTAPRCPARPSSTRPPPRSSPAPTTMTSSPSAPSWTPAATPRAPTLSPPPHHEYAMSLDLFSLSRIMSCVSHPLSPPRPVIGPIIILCFCSSSACISIGWSLHLDFTKNIEAALLPLALGFLQ
jgi:hypothetical protein